MNSYGLWIATEINEHYDCDDSRSSFIKVAFGRQVAAQKPLVLWDLNPCNPSHRIYTDYIDNYLENYIGGYQYQHFTIDDNLSITSQRKAEIKSQYVIGSIWYRRDILGERCIAEGLVYPMYEEAFEEPPESRAERYALSIDYGTMNAFAVTLWGQYGAVWWAVDEYYYSGRESNATKTDDEYYSDLEKWLKDIPGRLYTVIDPSAASFIALLRKNISRYNVKKAQNDVLKGIEQTAVAMQRGIIKFSPKCKNIRREFESYVWDDNTAEDKPVKVNDHAMDNIRYFVATSGILAQTQHKAIW